MIECCDAIEMMSRLPSSSVGVMISDPDWKQLTSYDWVTFLKEGVRVTGGGAIVLMWSASPKGLQTLFRYSKESGVEIKHLFVWAKPNGGPPTGYGISRRWEVVAWLGGARDGELRYTSDVFAFNRVTRRSKEDKGHPNQKPETLAERLIKFFSKPGDVVADFMCGSGTFLAVASRLGRKVIGSDTDPRWVEVTRKRVNLVERRSQNDVGCEVRES